MESYAAKQIDKFIASHPVLKEIFGAIGLDGQGIVNGIKNIWGIFTGEGSLLDKFKTLGKNLVEDLKKIAVKLFEWGMKKLTAWVNNLANKVLDKIIAWLGKMANGSSSSIIKKGLEWLKSQAEACKKKGAIATLTNNLNMKAVDWVKKKMEGKKPDPGAPVYEGIFYKGGGGNSQGGSNGGGTQNGGKKQP